jgi:pilus assembly protein CpaB
VLAAAVAQGQMLAEAMLAPEGSLAGLEAAVPRGMRAVSIDINEVTGLAGLIGPGAFVDVVTTLRDDASGETVGRTILQNVKVSAVGQRIAPKTDPKGMVVNDVSKSATLIVTPEQAEALDVAATRAKLRLILRNSRDTAEVETPGVKLTTLVRPNGGTAGMLEAGGRLMQQFALAMQQARQSAPPPPPATRPSAPAAPPPPAPQKLFVQVIRAGTETTKEFQLQPDADGQPSGPTSETATKGGSPGASIAQDGR